MPLLALVGDSPEREVEGALNGIRRWDPFWVQAIQQTSEHDGHDAEEESWRESRAEEARHVGEEGTRTDFVPGPDDLR